MQGTVNEHARARMEAHGLPKYGHLLHGGHSPPDPPSEGAEGEPLYPPSEGAARSAQELAMATIWKC